MDREFVFPPRKIFFRVHLFQVPKHAKLTCPESTITWTPKEIVAVDEDVDTASGTVFCVPVLFIAIIAKLVLTNGFVNVTV